MAIGEIDLTKGVEARYFSVQMCFRTNRMKRYINYDGLPLLQARVVQNSVPIDDELAGCASFELFVGCWYVLDPASPCYQRA